MCSKSIVKVVIYTNLSVRGTAQVSDTSSVTEMAGHLGGDR